MMDKSGAGKLSLKNRDISALMCHPTLLPTCAVAAAMENFLGNENFTPALAAHISAAREKSVRLFFG